MIGANYTYAKATDNSLGILQTARTNSSESHRSLSSRARQGIRPVHRRQMPTDRLQAETEISLRQAGTFVNGPDLDKGPSSLALDHIFQVNGLVDLPWQFQISGIFRAQSGFHFSRFDALNRDPDGNGNFNGIDFTAGRNAFTAPSFVNLDLRFSKRFDIKERVTIQLLVEFFNVLNRQNPAAVQTREVSSNRTIRIDNTGASRTRRSGRIPNFVLNVRRTARWEA